MSTQCDFICRNEWKKAQSKTVWKGKVIFILLIFLRKLTLLTCIVSTKTCPNGLERSLLWDMEDEGHQPIASSLCPWILWTGDDKLVWGVGCYCTTIFCLSTFLISPSVHFPQGNLPVPLLLCFGCPAAVVPLPAGTT